MTNTPIFDQLRRELGDPREPMARLQVVINEALATLGSLLGISEYIAAPDPAAQRRAYWADAILTGRMPKFLLSLSTSPIYDRVRAEVYPADTLPALTVRRWLPGDRA
ncbi:MAG: hypothetical protein CK431_04435 [Mycobacterium sp.]|nr:MAG: hypothetical protein CK431_04435 [Mycobacterium sp.]